MRDLTGLGIDVPEVEDPKRFFPDPVFIKRPQMRPLPDGRYELYIEQRRQWAPIHPICVDIIDALEKGMTFDEMIEAVPPFPEINLKGKAIARFARKFVWNLHTMGFVRLDLEPAPDVFNGRYARIKELGRGGLGIAHLCHDLKENDREVVVKHPWGVKSKIHHGQAALAIEIHLLSRLRHDALPHMYDHFTVRGLLHLVRDFVPGSKVSSAYGKNGTPERAWRVDIATQIGDALAYINEQGYLFFDPSPDNFFLSPDRKIMVSDVGGCRPHTDGAVELNGPRGTPGYVAPEIRRKSRHKLVATIASDVWSFGCLYYFLTMGHRPKRLWRQDEIHASLADANVELHPDDRALIEACCQNDPAKRPETIRAALSLIR